MHVGRVTRTRSPLRVGSGSPLAGDDAAGLPRTFCEERFYYDGIRRIQEVVVDTLVDTGTTTAPPVSRLSREYVWGPGGVDELLAQFDGAPAGTLTADAAAIQARPWFALLDGGGDVVALVEVPLASPLDPVPQGRVAGQWTYDAYGSVTSAETLTLQAFPALHAGHKGLFVDRLDVPVAQTSGAGTSIVAETPRLVPLSQGLYQNRNRTYAPGLGRFMQQDPNATAMVLMESAAYHGSGMGALVAAFSMERMYGDGGNLYEYLGSNTAQRMDPLGLFQPTFLQPFDPYVTVPQMTDSRSVGRNARGALNIALLIFGFQSAGNLAAGAGGMIADRVFGNGSMSDELDVTVATQLAITMRSLVGLGAGLVPLGVGNMYRGVHQIIDGRLVEGTANFVRGMMTGMLVGSTGRGFWGNLMNGSAPAVARGVGASAVTGLGLAAIAGVSFLTGVQEHMAYEVYRAQGVRGALDLYRCFDDALF